MKRSQKEKDNYIQRIIDVTATIKTIYDDLAKAYGNAEKTKELEEYLDLAISVENKIYKEIGDELLVEDLFINRITYLINRSDLKDKLLIENRIINYIAQKTYANPFLSRERYKEYFDNENIITIQAQITIDYVKATLLTVDEFLEKATNKKDKKRLANAKYSTIFLNKAVDTIMKNEKSHQINGRERCLIFNHDEELVQTLYSNHANGIINTCLYQILANDENIFWQIQLKSTLHLLTKDEISNVAWSYHHAITSNPQFQTLSKDNPNHEIILNTIRPFLVEEEKNKNIKK